MIIQQNKATLWYCSIYWLNLDLYKFTWPIQPYLLSKKINTKNTQLPEPILDLLKSFIPMQINHVKIRNIPLLIFGCYDEITLTNLWLVHPGWCSSSVAD
jgi:hypothetical protein